MTNIGAVEIMTPGDRQIVVTRIFDAPRAVVFEAWTKAEHVTHWWDPSGVPLAVCEIDLRPNGAFRWVNRAPDGGEGHSFAGIYREIVPPEKLVFAGSGGVGTLVFTDLREKTKLTLTIECATSNDRAALLQMRVDAGTAQTLENLAAYLPQCAQASTTSRARVLQKQCERRIGGPMKRIALAVILAIVACGALAIWLSGGQTVKSVGENRTTTSRDGTIIAFTKMGSGPPLIIVDGAFCYRENGPATDLASLLAQHFTVFTYDRRGRGESGDTAPYTVQREIEDFQAITSEAGAAPFVVGISSGGALILQAVASGVGVKKIALYEPPYVTDGNGPRSFEDAKNRLQSFVSAGDRAGAARFFMTDVYGAPSAFVYAMPFLMPNAWKRNKLVAHTLPYDLTIISDRSVLNERSSSISVPTLVIGGEKSPQELRDAVSTVANALPNGHGQFLSGQDHNVSSRAVVPVLFEYFGTS